MNTPRIRLKELSELITKGTTPTSLGFDFADNGVGFLRVQNVSGGRVNYEQDTLFINTQVHQALKRSQILSGDVLLSIAGTIGRTGVVPENAPPLNCNQAVAIVRPTQKVFRSYLRHWLESNDAQSQMRGSTVTGTIQNLSLTQVGNLQVPLPSHTVQKRIAAILDQADAVRVKRKEALAQLDRLTQAIFIDMFGDPLTNPNEIKQLPLGDLLKLKSGNFLPSTEMAEGGLFPVFGGNGINGYHDKYMFSQPQIIIGRVGAYCGCVHITPPTSWVTDNALYISDIDPLLNFGYLAYYLKQANLNQYASQSAQPLISGARLYPVKVLVPPLHLQSEFIERSNAVEKLRNSHIAILSDLDDLFASLQHRAFRGEL